MLKYKVVETSDPESKTERIFIVSFWNILRDARIKDFVSAVCIQKFDKHPDNDNIVIEVSVRRLNNFWWHISKAEVRYKYGCDDKLEKEIGVYPLTDSEKKELSSWFKYHALENDCTSQ